MLVPITLSAELSHSDNVVSVLFFKKKEEALIATDEPEAKPYAPTVSLYCTVFYCTVYSVFENRIRDLSSARFPRTSL